MDIVFKLVVVAHLVGMAAIVGGWMVAQRESRVLRPMLDGAYAQLLTGLILVALAESGAVDEDLNMAKIGVKLLVALAVAVLAFRNRAKPSVSRGVLNAIGGLALANVAVAVLW